MTRINEILTPQNIVTLGLIIFAVSLPVSHVPVQFSIVIILWGWLSEGLIYRKWMYRFHYVYVSIAMYLLWNIIVSILSPRPLHSLWAIMDNEWPLIIMLFMFWTIRDKEILKKLVFISLIMTFIACGYGMVQTITGYEFIKRPDLAPMGSLYRAIGFYSFYLSFALIALYAFFMSLAFISEYFSNVRKYFYVVAIVSMLTVIGTFARSVWFAILILIPIYGFLKNKKVGIIVTAIMLISILILWSTSKEVQERASSMLELSDNTTRINLWKTSINIIKDNPVFGVGQDNFDHIVNKYLVSGVYDTKAHPHNDYLNVAVNSGIPGLFAFISIWVITILTGYKVWRKTKDYLLKAISFGATLCLVGYLIAALFQNYYGTFINCWLWWFTTGLIYTSYALEQEGATAKSNN